MKTIIFLLLCIVLSVHGWVGIAEGEPEKAPLEGCYTSHKNIGAIQKDEIKRIEGQCATARCGANGDVKLTGCGVVRIGPPCRKEKGDLSKPFPKCCYEKVCPEVTDKTEAVSDSLNENTLD